VRRAKLYYLRELSGRRAKIRERRIAVPEEGVAAAPVTAADVEESPVEGPVESEATAGAVPEATAETPEPPEAQAETGAAEAPEEPGA
jgi:hypothetical protein